MSQSENIVQTVKTAIQDIVAPDVRDLKANMSALNARMASLEETQKVHFEALKELMKAQAEKLDARFDALLARLELNNQ